MASDVCEFNVGLLSRALRRQHQAVCARNELDTILLWGPPMSSRLRSVLLWALPEALAFRPRLRSRFGVSPKSPRASGSPRGRRHRVVFSRSRFGVSPKSPRASGSPRCRRHRVVFSCSCFGVSPRFSQSRGSLSCGLVARLASTFLAQVIVVVPVTWAVVSKEGSCPIARLARPIWSSSPASWFGSSHVAAMDWALLASGLGRRQSPFQPHRNIQRKF